LKGFECEIAKGIDLFDASFRGIVRMCTVRLRQIVSQLLNLPRLLQQHAPLFPF